ncbi:MAG: lipocalin-like domain-containing protein [Muribaculaceae bacterium]
MKHFCIIFATVVAFALSACHYHNINGDLDGNWRFLTIEQADGSVTEPDEAFLAIQMHTFNIRLYGAGRCAGNLYYDKKAKTLALEFPYENKLSAIGFPKTPCTVNFHIEHLTKERLVMHMDSNNAIYTFEKF